MIFRLLNFPIANCVLVIISLSGFTVLFIQHPNYFKWGIVVNGSLLTIRCIRPSSRFLTTSSFVFDVFMTSIIGTFFIDSVAEKLKIFDGIAHDRYIIRIFYAVKSFSLYNNSTFTFQGYVKYYFQIYIKQSREQHSTMSDSSLNNILVGFGAVCQNGSFLFQK